MFSIIFMFSKLYSMFSNPGVQDSTICWALLVPTSRYLMSKIAKICWHPKQSLRTTIWFFLRGGVIRRNVFDNWICGGIGWTSFVSVIFCICVFLFLLERSLIIGFVEEVVGHRCTPFSTLRARLSWSLVFPVLQFLYFLLQLFTFLIFLAKSSKCMFSISIWIGPESNVQ